mgnify:CR=1 FL=1
MKRIIVIPSTRILAIIWVLSLFIILILTISINTNPTVEAKFVFSKKWGTQGSGNGQFNDPSGITIDSSGRLYVVDTGNNRIQQFRLVNPCPSGTTQIVAGVCFVRSWGSLGTGNGQFNKPLDVALDSAGRVYVADLGNHRIQMFRGTGAFMKAWSTDGPGSTQFNSLTGIAVDASTNDIYALDKGDSTNPPYMHKFQLSSACPNGATKVVSGVCFISKWEIGDSTEPPGFNFSPRGVGVNSLTHEAYVSLKRETPHQYWIYRYSSSGTKITEWGGFGGSTDGKFSNPNGIAIDSIGRVYVADSRIQSFLMANPCPSDTTQVTPGVCFVTKLVPGGIPIDVAIGLPSGRLYALDRYDNSIQEFVWKADVGGTGGAGGGISPNVVPK